MPIGPKGQKRPADVVSNAVHIMKVLTGEAGETEKHPQSSALGDRAAKGGAARAASLDKNERSALARKAAAARWKKD